MVVDPSSADFGLVPSPVKEDPTPVLVVGEPSQYSIEAPFNPVRTLYLAHIVRDRSDAWSLR